MASAVTSGTGRSAAVIVIGAGIAGLAVARKLVECGLFVTVLEKEAAPALHASGNVAGILSPYILSQHDRSGEYLGRAFAYTLEWLKNLDASGHPRIFSQTGIVQLPATRRITRMIAEAQSGELTNPELAVLSAKDASAVSGVTLNSAALWYARGGWVKPKDLCDVLASDHRVSVKYNTAVSDLVRSGESWTVKTKIGESLTADYVVVANAYECAEIPLTKWLPVEAVRGVIATAAPVEATKGLRSVVCHNGYIIPYSASQQVLGTTYRHGIFHRERDEGEELELKSSIAKWIPAANPTLESVRVCFRTSTADRLPYVGRFCSKDGEIIPGVFVSVGHGSRGIVSAPFASQLIAQMICQEAGEGVASIVAPGRVRTR